MLLGQKVPVQRLGIVHGTTDDVTDDVFARIVHLTGAFQRRLEVPKCTHLSPDIFGKLQFCVSLITLDVSHTAIASIDSLSTCTRLQELNLSSCSQVTDLDVLEVCGSNLTKLLVRYTSIVSLAPLASCPQLRELDIGSTRVDTLDPLEACMCLEAVLFDSTEVDSLDALSAHPVLHKVSFECSAMTKKSVKAWLIKTQKKHGSLNFVPARSSLFFEAVLKNDVEAVRRCLDGGLPVDERASPRLEKKFIAAFETVCRCRTRFFDVSDPDPQQRPTALHLAVFFGLEGMVALLMEHGANPTLQARLGVLRKGRGDGQPPLSLHGPTHMEVSCLEIPKLNFSEFVYRETFRLVQRKIPDWKTNTHVLVVRLEALLDKSRTIEEMDETEETTYPSALGMTFTYDDPSGI